jgi:hypothetical protein
VVDDPVASTRMKFLVWGDDYPLGFLFCISNMLARLADRSHVLQQNNLTDSELLCYCPYPTWNEIASMFEVLITLL